MNTLLCGKFDHVYITNSYPFQHLEGYGRRNELRMIRFCRYIGRMHVPVTLPCTTLYHTWNGIIGTCRLTCPGWILHPASSIYKRYLKPA